jgi:hypothetical protein
MKILKKLVKNRLRLKGKNSVSIILLNIYLHDSENFKFFSNWFLIWIMDENKSHNDFVLCQVCSVEKSVFKIGFNSVVNFFMKPNNVWHFNFNFLAFPESHFHKPLWTAMPPFI